MPLHRLEWAFEWLNYGVSRWAFVAFLDQLTRFSVLIVVVLWILGAEDRRRERHYQAWQTISAATGRSGDLGRSIALRDLAETGVELTGVDLTGAVLSGIELPGVDMPWAILDSVTCIGCVLSPASLSLARFRAAWLDRTNFEGAVLNQTDFLHAQVINVDFRSADLSSARFAYALLGHGAGDHSGHEHHGTRFRAAHLTGAILDSARVGAVDFTGADLRYASLRHLRAWRQIASLRGANIYGVLDPPEGFMAWAVDTMGAVVAPSVADWREQVASLLTNKEWEWLERAESRGPARSSRSWWESVDEEDAAGGDGRW